MLAYHLMLVEVSLAVFVMVHQPGRHAIVIWISWDWLSILLYCIALHCSVLYRTTLSFPQAIHATPPLFVLSCHSPSCNSLLRCTFQSPRTTGMESFCNDTNSSDSSASFSMRSLTSCKSNEVWKPLRLKQENSTKGK